MSTVFGHSMELTAGSPEETRRLGRILGEHAPGGTVIGLIGDPGSGKTVFAQGIAIGMGVPATDYVVSPTYTLVNEHMGRLPLFHLDLYRLDNAVDLDHIGLDDMMESNGVVVIEWVDRFDRFVLPRHVDIHLTATGEKSRRIQINGYGLDGVNLISGVDFSVPATHHDESPSTNSPEGAKE